MRKDIAVKSSIVGVFSKIVTILFSIVCTRVFMRQLGVEIRGINGLITNVLSLLQLAEMGIGTAIIYALYQPLSENNREEVNILMSFYKKIYRYIGILVILIGFILSFFLSFFIEDTTYSWNYVRLIYFIQLIASASTYFFAYKRNLLYADQKMYITTLIDTCSNIIASLLKIYVMLVFKSYILFLVIQIAQTLFSNIIVNIYCNKEYPYINEPCTKEYDKMPILKENVKDLLIGKIGGFVYGSTDNLIISKFVGIIEVGVMSNYYQVSNMISMLSSSITEPIQPIIGNYIHTNKDVKKAYNLFLSYSFVRFCIANTVCVGMIVMSNPLISLWVGEEYTLSIMIPVLMAIDIFIAIVHGPTGEFISVLGLFKDDKNMSYIGIVINLVTSIVFVYAFGTIGVLLGTVLSQVYYWIARGYIVFHKYFKSGIWQYLKKIVEFIFITVVDILILFWIKNKVFSAVSLVTFILECMLCVFVSWSSIIMVYRRTDEFQLLIEMINKVLRRSSN